MKDLIIWGDARKSMRHIPEKSVNAIVTSPPYYALRNYGVRGQIGSEPSPQEYIQSLVNVFRAARRVLRDDGTVWINIGDTYAANRSYQVPDSKHPNMPDNHMPSRVPSGLKAKDLMMIPARLALALQADGWYLRSQIIWHKKNAMPENVKDRPTNDYELVYLLSKSARYYYDYEAVKEPAIYADSSVSIGDKSFLRRQAAGSGRIASGNALNDVYTVKDYRNKRAVWTINTSTYPEAHFATMPVELAATCIKAACPEYGIVFDPFGGAATTAIAAMEQRKHYLLIELNGSYIELAQKRIKRWRDTHPFGVQLSMAL